MERAFYDINIYISIYAHMYDNSKSFDLQQASSNP